MHAEFKTTYAMGGQGSQTYDQRFLYTCIDARDGAQGGLRWVTRSGEGKGHALRAGHPRDCCMAQPDSLKPSRMCAVRERLSLSG